MSETVVLERDPKSKDGLLLAMLGVQSEAPKLRKGDKATVRSDKGSYTYTYIDLADIVEKISPLLVKHWLVWSTKPSYDATSGEPTLKYKLAHAVTKEFEEGEMKLLLGKPDAQQQGSGITYARRYALCAVLNLVADDDDDGNSASAQTGAQGGQRPAQPRMGSTAASEKQIGFVKRLFAENNLTTRERCALLRGAGVGLPEMRDEMEAVKAVDEALKGLFKHQASALLNELKPDTEGKA